MERESETEKEIASSGDGIQTDAICLDKCSEVSQLGLANQIKTPDFRQATGWDPPPSNNFIHLLHFARFWI